MLKTKYVLKQNTSCSQRVWELNGNSTPRPWFTGIDIDCAGRRTTTHADRGAAPLRVTGRRHLRKSYRPRRRTSRGVSGHRFSRVIFAETFLPPQRDRILHLGRCVKVRKSRRRVSWGIRRWRKERGRTENAATAAPRGRRPFQRRARATAVVSRGARNASAYEYSNQFRAGAPSFFGCARSRRPASTAFVRLTHVVSRNNAPLYACARVSVHSQRLVTLNVHLKFLHAHARGPGRAPYYIYSCTWSVPMTGGRGRGQLNFRSTQNLDDKKKNFNLL